MVLHQDFYQGKVKKNIYKIGTGFAGDADGSNYQQNQETDGVISIKNSLLPVWRTATLHVIDKSNNRLLRISEPYWQYEENRMAVTTKKRLYDIYMEYNISQTYTGENL
jgi:hypothetical protein